MSSTREILTLQFGSYANYVGAHWWNIQEAGFSYDTDKQNNEINHDVLYREGVNLNRQTTFTPRLLLVDLEGSLKHMPREGELYGNSIKRTCNSETELQESLKKLKEDQGFKDEEVAMEIAPEAAVSNFQKDLDNPEAKPNETDYKLADTVESWVDYLYARYHPRTVNIVKDFRHSTERQSFDTFSAGALLWRSEQFEDEFCDKIRQYVEESDYMQGFQTIFDCDNAYSGLATKCLEHLNDEFTKAIFAVPVFAPKSIPFENADEAMTDSIRCINSALAFNQLTEGSSLFLPMSTSDRVWRQLGGARSIRGLDYKADNLYQTSAILASYLDTVSLRYRLKNAPQNNLLAGFCGDMTNYGRKMAAAALALPFPMQHDEDLIDCLDKFEGPLFTQLTPSCTMGTDYIIQSLCVRGIPRSRLKRPLEEAKKQMRMSAYKCDSVSEMFQLYLQCANHASLSHVTAVEQSMPTSVPYPREMFNTAINTKGFISPTQKRTTTDFVESVPTLAAIQSSSSLSDTLETLHREAKRIKVAKLHRFKSAGLEDDDLDSALENLLLFKDNYEDNFEL